MTINELLSLSFAAIFAENMVFVRLFGADALPHKKESLGALALAMIPVTALSVGFASVLSGVLPIALELVVFALLAAVFAKLAELVCGAFTKEKANIFPVLALNASILGTMLTGTDYGFTEALVYGAAAAIGFDLALFIYNGVEKRLRLSSPSGSFAGAPLTLIAMGLVAMAFTGFGEIELGNALSLPFKGA